MAGEERARRIIQKELNRVVTINDDGRRPSMYDLRIGPADKPEMAIECIGAVDRVYTETWNIGPAKGPLTLAITGDWVVTISAEARVKEIKSHLEGILQKLEDRNLLNIHVDYRLKWYDAALFDELESLKIIDALCYRVSGTGTVHIVLPGNGGVVDERGCAIPVWVGDFLRDPHRQDVLSKLTKSGATECHVFLLVSLMGSSWLVESYLMGPLDQLPEQAPDLPLPVTGVWIASTMSQKGLRWDGNNWQQFEACGKGVDD